MPEPLADLLDAAAADLVTLLSPEGVYSYVSPVARRMLGREASDMAGRPWQEFVHPDDVDLAKTALATAMSSAGRVVVSRHRLASADGSYLWTESAIRAVPPQGPDEATALLASVRDIGDRRVVEARLEHQALTDPLTGIANRTVLMDRLGQGLRRLHRDPSVLALIYLDLDRFKLINDSSATGWATRCS